MTKEYKHCNIETGEFCKIMEEMFHPKWLHLPLMTSRSRREAEYTKMPVLEFSKKQAAYIQFCPFCGVHLYHRMVPLNAAAEAYKAELQAKQQDPPCQS